MKENKVCGIYKITSPTGCIYIGQSRDCYYRESKYRRAGCKGQHRILNSIKKYGWESHKFEVIHECREEELNHWEKYYVDLFGTFNSEKGLNIRDGGGSKGKPSEETKQLNSVSLKRAYALGIKYRPIGERNGMYGNGHKLAGEKNGRYGMAVSEETRKKVSESNKSKWDEIRRNGGRTLSAEDKLKKAKSHLARLGKDGTIGKYYGVFTPVGSKKYYSYIKVGAKRNYIGAFVSENEAALAFNQAQIKHFGKINFYNKVTIE